MKPVLFEERGHPHQKIRVLIPGSSPDANDAYKNRHGRGLTRPSSFTRQMRGSSPRMTYYKNRHGRA
jgi:hypothetical protein